MLCYGWVAIFENSLKHWQKATNLKLLKLKNQGLGYCITPGKAESSLYLLGNNKWTINHLKEDLQKNNTTDQEERLSTMHWIVDIFFVHKGVKKCSCMNNDTMQLKKLLRSYSTYVLNNVILHWFLSITIAHIISLLLHSAHILRYQNKLWWFSLTFIE